MVSEFLLNKWRVGFLANDINKDGYISIEDSNLFADRFIKHHGMSEERAARLRSEHRAFWNEMFMYDKEKIYPDTFVELMTQEYLADKEKFRDRMFKVIQKMVDSFDANDDGRLSYDEYIVVLKCWGIKTLDNKFLDAYPQSPKGYVPKEIYRDSWVAYITNPNDKDIEVEKPTLFGFRIIDDI